MAEETDAQEALLLFSHCPEQTFQLCCQALTPPCPLDSKSSAWVPVSDLRHSLPGGSKITEAASASYPFKSESN